MNGLTREPQGREQHFQGQAIDAQRNAVHRFEGTTNPRGMGMLLLLGMLLVLGPAAQAAGGGAVVSGVVRDAQGIAQMGALVQVLTTNSATVATSFTDARGRYSITDLTPGRYLVRASAMLFVPATKANLQLRTGAVTVVNLTLGALFDTTSWLPAQRRRADEPEDDWKWTLRSSANRPILRLTDDGALIEVSSSESAGAATEKMRARATVASGDGEFGAGGIHNILAIHRMTDDGGDMTIRTDIATNLDSTRIPVPAPAQEFEAGYEQRRALGGSTMRTVVSYKAHPELLAAGSTAGLQIFSTTSAQRMSVGELLAIEAGSSMQVINAGSRAVAMQPFIRLTTHPMGVWTLHYRMASDRQVQGFEDVTTGESAIPVALVRNGKLALESGRHQEAAVDRRAGRGTVSLAYYHDALTNTAVSGGATTAGAKLGSDIPAGMLVDPTTGSFRTLGAGYRTNGARLTVSTPLIQGLWVAAEYSMGEALASESGPLTAFPAALAALKAEAAQAGTLALKSRMKVTGTQIRAAYRWQPSKFVTAVDSYSTFSDQAFLSCQLRQPIRWGARLPSGLDATIDVTNLLAQGYRPFLSADGQTLYFAQSPRTIQGGISFTF